MTPHHAVRPPPRHRSHSHKPRTPTPSAVLAASMAKGPVASTSVYTQCVIVGALLLLLPWIPVAAAMAQSPWCPASCQCDAGAVHVQCSQAGLLAVPHGVPPTVQHLNLSGNTITHISGEDLHNLTQLNSLDLSYNDIVNISRGAFTNLTTLEFLLLHGNQLQRAPELDNLPVLHSLDLSGNNFTSFELSTPLASLSDLDLNFNSLTELPASFLQNLQNLTHLDVQYNQLRTFFASVWDEGNTSLAHPLQVLNLAGNSLSSLAPSALQSLSELRSLDLSHNGLLHVHKEWFGHSPHLQYVSLSQNPFTYLPNNAFANTSNLQTLDLSSLNSLKYISVRTLEGLANLQSLNLSHNPSLEFIHAEAFQGLTHVQSLDISNNGLSIVHPATFHNLTNLQALDLHGNPWACDCEAQDLHDWTVLAVASGLLKGDLICAKPDQLAGMRLQEVPTLNMTCEGAKIVNHTHQIWVKIGRALVVDCVVDGNPRPAITWRTSRGQLLHYEPHFYDFSLLDPSHEGYHDDHGWHEPEDRYLHKMASAHNERIQVLKNGSLYIDYMTRRDGGNYTCVAQNEWGNDTVLVEVRLDYTLFETLKLETILCGFLCAATFFSVTVLTSAIRFVIFFFSEEERKKRKSIREVLEAIRDYKASKVEKLSAYKTAKLDQLSALKDQKFDQLAQFKTGKMEKLSAFKENKVGKILSYKQATVTNVLHHMHHLREYYTNQMNRVKDNCSMQVGKVRDNYTSQMDKFKDYRSHQIDKIRDNYNNQVVRIRDYSAGQMTRLRDQYKTQQLHILKLLELLDVGNCMTLVEAECMRTESMIFDPDMLFGLDDKHVQLPRHPRDIESSGESEYMTAGTGTGSSDQSSVLSAPYVLSVHNEKADLKKQEKDGKAEEPMEIDITDPTEGPSCSAPQPKSRKKKRHKRRPPEVNVGDSCDSLEETSAAVDLAAVHGSRRRRYPPRIPLVLATAASVHSPDDREDEQRGMEGNAGESALQGGAEVELASQGNIKNTAPPPQSNDTPKRGDISQARTERRASTSEAIILRPAALDDLEGSSPAQAKETIV